MTAERIAELRKLATTETRKGVTAVPNRELLEMLDLAELGIRTMPRSAQNIAKRHARGRLLARARNVSET